MARRKNLDLTAIIPRLGQVSDRVIAEECGVSIRCVGQWRQARGIPAYLPERQWTRRELRLLGTMSDAELARKLRRTPHGVKTKRRSMGICPVQPPPEQNYYDRLIEIAEETTL